MCSNLHFTNRQILEQVLVVVQRTYQESCHVPQTIIYSTLSLKTNSISFFLTAVQKRMDYYGSFMVFYF